MSSNGPISSKFFGLIVGNNGQYWPTQQICGSWRSWDSMNAWKSSQVISGGTIDFVGGAYPIDTAINTAISKGVDVLVTLALTPPAMSLATALGASVIGAANPTNTTSGYTSGTNSPPQNLNDWITYVTAFGNRYSLPTLPNPVLYYEIWNEIQDTAFFSGTIGGLADAPSTGTVNYGPGSDMYNLVKSASIALKAINPNIKILSPSAVGVNAITTILPLLQDLISGGYVDIIAYHCYSNSSNPASPTFANSGPEGVGSMLPSIQNLFSVLKSSTIPSTIPIWNTEFGIEMANANGTVPNHATGWYTALTGEQQNALLMRHFIVAASFKIDRSFWYTFDNSSMGMLEYSSQGVGVTGDTVTHKPVVGAFLTMRYWLTGRRVSDIKFDSQNQTYYCKVTDDKGFNGMLVWSTGGVASSYMPPSGYTQYQYYGLQSPTLGNGNIFSAPAYGTSMSFVGGTGGVSSTTLVVTSGSVIAGVKLSGAGVTAGAYVLSFDTVGTTGTGGAGNYVLSTACTITAGTTITAQYPIAPPPIDMPSMQMLPNPISLVEGSTYMPAYNLTPAPATYSPPNTFTVATASSAAFRVGYKVSQKQYCGYGLITRPLPAAGSTITLYLSPIMLLA